MFDVTSLDVDNMSEYDELPFLPVLSVDEQTALFKQSVTMNITQSDDKDNPLRRVELMEFDNRIDEYRCT